MKCASRRNECGNVRNVRLAGASALVCLIACFVISAELRASADSPQSPVPPSQAQIAAAFIFNFAKFTEWPPQSFADSASPLTVCFLGAEDVRSALQSISAGKVVDGRSVLVRDAKAASDIHDCQMVYMDSTNAMLLAGVLKNARQCNALAIGTSEDFLVRGGMIKLFVENNRMRFDVNVGATGRIKIRLSSKLLALARSVVSLPDPAGN